MRIPKGSRSERHSLTQASTSPVCIWVKNSLVLGRSDYQWQHEPVLYGFLQNGKHPWYSDRKQTTIWNYDKPKRNKDHPTSKPLDLLGYPIQNSSQENSVVIDTFGGSGSTLMACEQLNRICYMMELDPKYASVILRRYVEDTGDEENVYVIRNAKSSSIPLWQRKSRPLRRRVYNTQFLPGFFGDFLSQKMSKIA